MSTKSSLSPEENLKLKELKRLLINTQNETERHSALKEIEQLLNKAKRRFKFISALDEKQSPPL
ncbi:hypothetical protein AABM38_02245 [Heyndrickxia sp. MSNUG]|uniref:hypothetical protein n=1 Tax=Heyndrickxia sp. MSNUG TaxID=3136677 RepID=UPI003C2BFE58